MRHRNSGRRLNRSSQHRKAMFRNMTASLVEHELIKTTVAKAKELRRVAEPLITLAKTDSVANRRLVFNRLRDKAAVGKLFAELGPRYQQRPGGYIRVLKCGYRAGDKAPMAYVELVGRPQFQDDPDQALMEHSGTKASPVAPAPVGGAAETPSTVPATEAETTEAPKKKPFWKKIFKWW